MKKYSYFANAICHGSSIDIQIFDKNNRFAELEEAEKKIIEEVIKKQTKKMAEDWLIKNWDTIWFYLDNSFKII